jgi:hypothetical protein
MRYKFRGKSIEDGDNGWVYGYYIYNPNYKGFKGHYIGHINDGQLDFIMVNPETVGQFTSLYDKNDKEIYEVDMIRHNYLDEPMEVKFIDGCFHPVDYLDLKYVEVIGNKFDNPELLNY